MVDAKNDVSSGEIQQFEREAVKPEYARTTITVPWELKKRMKQLGNRVNWSAVACDAFEEKLEELGPIQEITSVSEALKRLKAIASHEGGVPDQAANDGLAVGKQWALNFALPDQLKKMEALKVRVVEKDDLSWEEFMDSKEGRRRLAKCIADGDDQMVDFSNGGPRRGRRGPSPEGFRKRRGGRTRHRDEFGPKPDHHDSQNHLPESLRGLERWEIQIWRSILTDRPVHPSFFLGFANGALDVWDQLKGQL